MPPLCPEGAPELYLPPEPVLVGAAPVSRRGFWECTSSPVGPLSDRVGGCAPRGRGVRPGPPPHTNTLPIRAVDGVVFV